jgi:predicted ribosomally synthesized peptide with nif11-like leader
MSHDELAAFLSEISENPELMEELRTIADGEGDDASIAPDELAKFAASKGREISADDIRSAFEVSDDELEAVAGGAVFAKYDGFDGEARGHEKWIDVLSIGRLVHGPFARSYKLGR